MTHSIRRRTFAIVSRFLRDHDFVSSTRGTALCVLYLGAGAGTFRFGGDGVDDPGRGSVDWSRPRPARRVDERAANTIDPFRPTPSIALRSMPIK